MPIADLFAAPAASKPVGTGRNGRNTEHLRAIEVFRPANRPVGTVGTEAPAPPTCSDRSDQSEQRSEREKPSICAAVPTVPTVPTANHDAGAPRPRVVYLDEFLAWTETGPIGRCRSCRFSGPLSERGMCAACEVDRLFAAAERVVNSPDALADPAELMVRGELP